MDILLSDDDIDLTNGQLSLVDGADAIAQQLRIRLRFFLGEWLLDQREGIPFYRSIFIKNPNMTLVNSVFQRAILSTPGIASLENFTSTVDNTTRELTLSFVCKTTDGDILEYPEFIIEVLN